MEKKYNLLELLKENQEGDPDYVESCLMSLTSLERKIVFILQQANEPIKVSEIRNKMIEAEINNMSKNSEKAKKVEKIKKQISGRHKMLAEVDKILDAQLPSFKTIETTLEQMQKDNIVIAKTTGSELSKNYWFIHPQIRSQMIKANKNLKREQNERLFGKQFAKLIPV
ncbi:hypothetical protein JW711_06370 [Candidatus Woesearchaeota archaeon]|nr:hypothetical protein [Candidatus Woesearchaeota archaeon]